MVDNRVMDLDGICHEQFENIVFFDRTLIKSAVEITRVFPVLLFPIAHRNTDPVIDRFVRIFP